MTETRSLVHSRKRIKKAGERLRDGLLAEVDLTPAELRAELMIIRDFRSCHAAPLTRVGAGLRYYVEKYSTVREDGRPVVAQRLKRMRTIADKLTREPGMNLARMHDIGGCRALFASVDEMSALIGDLEAQRRWTVREVRDYVNAPRTESGYRAFHVIVEKDGSSSSASYARSRSMPGQS